MTTMSKMFIIPSLLMSAFAFQASSAGIEPKAVAAVTMSNISTMPYSGTMSPKDATLTKPASVH